MGTADWRLASMNGSLIWVTSKTKPSQQMVLFSELSPTLVVGFKEHGGSPVDYIKFSSVVSVTHEHPATVTLSRKNSLHISLIAPTSEESFRWLAAVELALSARGSNFPLTTVDPPSEESQLEEQEENEKPQLGQYQQPLFTSMTRTIGLLEEPSPNGVRRDRNSMPMVHKTIPLRDLTTDNVDFVVEECMGAREGESVEGKLTFGIPPRPSNVKVGNKAMDLEENATEWIMASSSSQKFPMERVSSFKVPEQKFSRVNPVYAPLKDVGHERTSDSDCNKRRLDIILSSSHPSHHTQSSLPPIEQSPRGLQEAAEIRSPSLFSGSKAGSEPNDNNPQNMGKKTVDKDNCYFPPPPPPPPPLLSNRTTTGNATTGIATTTTTNVTADTGLSKQLPSNRITVIDGGVCSYTLPSAPRVYPSEAKEKDDVDESIERSLAKYNLILQGDINPISPSLFSPVNTSAIAKDELVYHNIGAVNDGRSSSSTSSSSTSSSNGNIGPRLVSFQTKIPPSASILAPPSLELLLEDEHGVLPLEEASARTFRFDRPRCHGQKSDDVSWYEDNAQKREISEKEEVEKKSFDREKEESTGLNWRSSGNFAPSVSDPNKSKNISRDDQFFDSTRSDRNGVQDKKQRVTAESVIDRIIRTPLRDTHRENISSSTPVVFIPGIETPPSRKPSTTREDSYLYCPIEALVAAIPRHTSPHTLGTLRSLRGADSAWQRNSVTRFSSRSVTPSRLASVMPSVQLRDESPRYSAFYKRSRHVVEGGHTTRRSHSCEKVHPASSGRDSQSFIQYSTEADCHDAKLFRQGGLHRLRSRSSGMCPIRKKPDYGEKERIKSDEQDWAAILMEPRLYNKHAVRSYGGTRHYVCLTGDGMHVVCIPALVFESRIHINNKIKKPGGFASLEEVLSLYGGDCHAMAIECIDHVSLGTAEAFTREWHLQRVGPERLVCIVSKRHAFLLEADTDKEADYLVKAWNAFL